MKYNKNGLPVIEESDYRQWICTLRPNYDGMKPRQSGKPAADGKRKRTWYDRMKAGLK